MLSAYQPINVVNSEISLQLSSSNLATGIGLQWWVSNNLQISGVISNQINQDFSLYSNIAAGYYNKNIKWLYSSSNIIEISLHTKKYPKRWLNASYKSRYNYNSIILGYDVNYFLWNNIEDSFISLIAGYNIKEKFTLELKTNIFNNEIYLHSINCSITL